MFSEVLDELVGLSDADLVARIEANELERRRLDAEMAAALAVAKERNLHGSYGHRSMAAFCRAKLNWSTTEAGKRLGLARAVDKVQGLGEAWSIGRFGLPQASKLAAASANPRIADQLGDFVPQLLVHAEQMPYPDFAAVVDHVIARADQDGAHDDREEAIEGRRARLIDVGGSLEVRASGGDGLVTAELMAIFDHFVDLEFRNDVAARTQEHGELADGFQLARTDRQRRFDALVAIFRAASAAGNVGSPAEPLVNVVIDAATWGRMLLAADLTISSDLDGRPIDLFTGLAVDDSRSLLDDLVDPATQMCETTTGVPLLDHDVLRAALAGHIRRTVVDSDRVIIDLGRRQRLFTGSTRVAAKLLIKRCEYIGCELPAEWCDVDHVDEWDRNRGPTNQRNAALLCRSDNLDKHRNGWRTKRARNGCSYTFDRSGTILLPVGARPPQFSDDQDHTNHPEETIDVHDDVHDVDDPEEIARITTAAHRRIDELIRSRS